MANELGGGSTESTVRVARTLEWRGVLSSPNKAACCTTITPSILLQSPAFVMAERMYQPTREIIPVEG